MGVQFSQCSAAWSYSGFDDFRVRLAHEIGIDLNAMEHFGGSQSWETIHDEIAPLLNHSDCDGQLSPDECYRVAPRLRELVAAWPEDDYNKRQALRLADGMEQIAEKGLPLEFL